MWAFVFPVAEGVAVRASVEGGFCCACAENVGVTEWRVGESIEECGVGYAVCQEVGGEAGVGDALGEDYVRSVKLGFEDNRFFYTKHENHIWVSTMMYPM